MGELRQFENSCFTSSQIRHSYNRYLVCDFGHEKVATYEHFVENNFSMNMSNICVDIQKGVKLDIQKGVKLYQKDMLILNNDKILFIPRPEAAPSANIWKGVLDSGKVGLFDSTDSTPYIEIKSASPLRSRIKISRRGMDQYSPHSI